MFLDHYPHELAKFAGVEPRTARRWQKGAQGMHPAHRQLIDLHGAGQVIPVEHWPHTRFIGQAIEVNGAVFTYLDLATDFLQRAELTRLRGRVAYLEQFEPARAPVIRIATAYG